MDLLSMGQHIRKQRELLSYTREDMAEKLQCSIKFCADIEAGASGVSVKNLLLLSDFLKLSTDYILKGNQEKTTLLQLFSCWSVAHRKRYTTLKKL